MAISKPVRAIFLADPDLYWSRVKIGTPDQCWLWDATVNHSTGYGVFNITHEKRLHSVGAHRVAYTLTSGPIPEGYEIDHDCWVPLCCNPRHLVALTHEEHSRRRIGRPRVSRVYPDPLADL